MSHSQAILVVVSASVLCLSSCTRNNTEQASLIACVKANDIASLETLLRDRVAVDQKDDNGRTALMWAAWCSNKDIVDLLIRYGSEVDLKDDDGWTALCFAASANTPEVLVSLIESGADINVRCGQGNWSLLMCAVWNRQKKNVEYLLSIGIDPNLRDLNNRTALQIAQSVNDREIVNLLSKAMIVNE